MTGKMADDPEIPETGKKNNEMIKKMATELFFLLINMVNF